MRLYTFSIEPMDRIFDEQLDGSLSRLRFHETRDLMRSILTDGSASHAAEHIKEEYVGKITGGAGIPAVPEPTSTHLMLALATIAAARWRAIARF